MEVRCPACGSPTQVVRGQSSICFSCGQPVPVEPTSEASVASIVGAVGHFAIATGMEVKVGRDPATCAITLNEPRVSGVHATLRFDGGQLVVRDEGSNNGTYVSGSRIPTQTWIPARDGTSLRFGPVEFLVRLDARALNP